MPRLWTFVNDLRHLLDTDCEYSLYVLKSIEYMLVERKRSE